VQLKDRADICGIKSFCCHLLLFLSSLQSKVVQDQLLTARLKADSFFGKIEELKEKKR
jgi:hypothetical protein